jgi:hypothetical protein
MIKLKKANKKRTVTVTVVLGIRDILVRIRMRIRMRIRDAQKHPDLDPEHWRKVIKKSQNRRNQGFSYYF